MIVSLSSAPEFDSLHKVYEDLGVTVFRVSVPGFHRDLFAWTPFGLVRPQITGTEERTAASKAWFDKLGRMHRFWLREGRFEGADMLWLTWSKVLIALSSGTNEAAARELTERLSWGLDNFAVHVTGLPSWHSGGRLSGLVNVVYGDHVYVDERALAAGAPVWAPEAIALPHEEYPWASSWVQYRDNIVINNECTKTISLLENVCNVHPVVVSDVARVTGIIQP